MAHALGGLARSSHTYWADTLALPESMCKVSTGSDDCSSSQSRSAVHGVGSGFARARGARELLALARRADAYSSSSLGAGADRSSITRGVPRWAPVAST